MATMKKIQAGSNLLIGNSFDSIKGMHVAERAIRVSGIDDQDFGGRAVYSARKVTSEIDFYETMDFNIGAGGSYLVLDADFSLNVSNALRYQSQSTYATLRASVDNAYKQWTDYEPTQAAINTMGDKERFRKLFGTHCVYGLHTGGRFYASLRVTSLDKKLEEELATEFSAAASIGFASADINTSFTAASERRETETKWEVSILQFGGRGMSLGMVDNFDGLLNRMKIFAEAVNSHPYPFFADIVPYDSLAAFTINDDFEFKEMVLNECAALKLKYFRKKDELSFARENEVYFENLPPKEDLIAAEHTYIALINAIQSHANFVRKANHNEGPILMFDPSALEPPISEPTISLKRLHVDTITIPDFTTNLMDINYAKTEAIRIGLIPVINFSYIPDEDAKPENRVYKQDPLPGTIVNPNSEVKLFFYIKDTAAFNRGRIERRDFEQRPWSVLYR